MTFNKSGIISECAQGLEAYKSRILSANGNFNGRVDVEEIRAVLRSKGVISDTPLITIPDTLEGLENAYSIGKVSKWFDPFTHEIIKGALNTRHMYEDAGKTIYDIGPANAFWSDLLNISVVFDTVDSLENANPREKIYPLARVVSQSAHEITHSAFAHLTNLQFKPRFGNQKSVEVESTFTLSQVKQRILLAPGFGTWPKYQPLWLDEGFAQYMAHEARAVLCPDSIPAKSYVADMSPYGVDEYEIPPKYLIGSNTFPDYPGLLAGMEGIGFDLLSEKQPWLINGIKAVIARQISVKKFHNMLANSVGSELKTAITTPRPYSEWFNIYRQIQEN